MKKIDLKSFDIASYDVEIEFNKKIAPITKKIEKLDSVHETKSLRAHKDFLAREKNSKGNLSELDDKAIMKEQRIEKAVENKLVKLRRKDQAIKTEFNEFKLIQNQANAKEQEKVNEQIAELQIEETNDVNAIKSKYKENVESYVEKLDTYNNNFENNKRIFSDQYAKYRQILKDSLEKIERVKRETDAVVTSLLTEFLERKANEDTESRENTQEVDRVLSKNVIDIRKNSNRKTIEAKEYTSQMKDVYEQRYTTYISEINFRISSMISDFEVRKDLISKDLEINFTKLEQQLEDLGEKKPRKTVKNINLKLELFNLRATTTIAYEEKLLNEKVSLLRKEIELIKATLKNELVNIQKLEIFLVNDQDQLKDTGEYFKALNLELKTQLMKSELANNEYLVKHEKLKTEFVNNYTKQYNDIKRRLIDANSAQIDQLSVINSELDDINKYLDTVEPLKEIELNKLRESIEVSEIQERFNIKYAKQDHETKILNNNNRMVISLEEVRFKGLLSENNKDITEIKNKEIYDKASEQAKLKVNKANEIYKLRLNSTKLERNILKSSYETELEKADFSKDLVALEVAKNNILLSKELKAQIKNIETEANYKIEVISKSLEEDLLKLDEKVGKISYERDSFTSTVDMMVSKEEHNVDLQIIQLNSEQDQKLSLVDEALNREIKEPTLNIARSEVIINERLGRFDMNTKIYNEFIVSTKELLQDETLTPDQIKQVIIKNKTVYDKSGKYVENAYDVLVEAVKFMNELETRSMLNKISSTAEQSATKKLKKQQTKQKSDFKKQLSSLESSKNDHKAKITAQIKSSLQRLGKQKNVSFESLKEQVDNIYAATLKSLNNLQENVIKEVKTLYLPLTKNDQDILDNANKNAVRAKTLIEKAREDKLVPISEALSEFIKTKEEEKRRVVGDYDAEIATLKGSIDSLKAIALTKVQEYQLERDQLNQGRQEKLLSVQQTEHSNIEDQIKQIGTSKLVLEQDYNDTLKQLDDKDSEAKKIYDYEERIYNIALETAESRFNDAMIKTEKAHELHLTDGEKDSQIISNNTERNVERINKELVEATNEFEKNIFTVRPRFEESIGDAQKAIDDEREIKERRKEELTDLYIKMTDSIENNLFTSFTEGYDKLNENLQYYLDKYKVIEEEYFASNNGANNVISNNHQTFVNALFELGKEKHSKTLSKLLETNKEINVQIS